MKRPIIYLNVLYLLLLIVMYLGFYAHFGKDVSFEKNGLQFEKITKSEALDPKIEPQAFIVYTNEIPSEILAFHGNEALDYSKIYQYEIPAGIIEPKEMLYLALSKSLIAKDSIEVQKIEDLLKEYKNKNIEAVRLIQHQTENGFIGFLNESPFAIFLFVIMLFVMIWILDYICHFSNLIKSIQISKFFIYSVFLISICGLFRGIKGAWYPSSETAEFILMVFIVLPIYLIYQYLNHYKLSKSKWYDAEMIKFLLIFGGSILLLFLGNELAYQFDRLQMDVVIRTPFFNSNTTMIIGIALAFALANLLNNLRRNKRLF